MTDPGGASEWEILAREPLGDFEVFSVHRLRARSPRHGQVFDRHVLHVPDWVNIVAFTEDGQAIMVEQYRFGAGVLSLEFPAGTLEEGEEPLDGARRELLEETGFEPAELRLVGTVYADPAVQDNLLHVVVARGCRLTGAQALDEGEDVHVRLVAPDALLGLVAHGEIVHGLAITAWAVAMATRLGEREDGTGEGEE